MNLSLSTSPVSESGLARALYRGAICLVALVVLVALGLQVKWVLVQLFAAAIVAAGMAPVVSYLSGSARARSWRWRPSPAVVVLLIYLVVGGLLLVLATILLQVLLDQASQLVQRMPQYAARIQDWYAALSERSPLVAELDVWNLLGGANGITERIVSMLGQLLNVAGVLLAVFGGAINVIFVLFIALYLTIYGEAIRDYLLIFLPAAQQPRARTVITHISSRLGRWVVGEFFLCLIIGTGSAIGFSILGVPGAAFLGVIWAISELIPGIGPFIAAVPSILLGFVAGVETGIAATIFTIVWSQVENNVVVPRVMSHAVKINALVVLVALLVGYELLGLAGALFAVPLAAALAVIVDELHHERAVALATEGGLVLVSQPDATETTVPVASASGG
jgi:predicted PurR-regulated permease PerM